MFNEDSFKWEMCRSDNLWTGKFVYKKHLKEESWFPIINELRKRTLQATGATGTGAKKHKLIINRFKRKVNWNCLTIKWVLLSNGLTIKTVLKRSLRSLWRSEITLLCSSTAGWLCWLSTGGGFQRCLLAAVNSTDSNKQQGTCPALEEALDNAAVKLLAMMPRTGD